MKQIVVDKLKYIAIYQVAPVSAITHYAEIASIEKWGDTNKYILKFKEAANAILDKIVHSAQRFELEGDSLRKN